jgi:hypothetical protein
VTINPPYRFDPLQNVVDVKWTSIFVGVTWFFPSFGSESESFDCPLGPGATTTSQLTFGVGGPIVIIPPGYTALGAPSVSPTLFSAGAGEYSAILFEAASQDGNGPGSASFNVRALRCSDPFQPETVIVSAFMISIPPIIVTETATANTFTIREWSANAAAGIGVTIVFEPSTA